jgi:hypothetical protein
MPNSSDVIDRLNDAVKRDWKAMHQLVENRVAVKAEMVDHPTIIVVPVQQQQGTSFLLGMLGVINGLVREDDKSAPIEAMFDDQNGELIGFKLRGDQTPAVDHRRVELTMLELGHRYRVKDRAGNRWEGLYMGPGKPSQEQGVYLRMADGATALIYFHDVANIIHA